MDFDQIKQILNLVREHELTELEIEHEGLRIKIRKDAAGAYAASTAPLPTSAPVIGGPAGSGAVAASQAASGPADAAVDFAVVKSPIVGTFYRSAEPGGPPFVDIGAQVKKGQVLCIIEAMKLMNEIDSEYDGEVVNIYVETGQPVQYGERLFAIKAAE
jgi:acetyl-CoA carboxylase biotin carboxyl carrier protein